MNNLTIQRVEIEMDVSHYECLEEPCSENQPENVEALRCLTPLLRAIEVKEVSDSISKKRAVNYGSITIDGDEENLRSPPYVHLVNVWARNFSCCFLFRHPSRLLQ